VLSFFDIVMVWNPGVLMGFSRRQPDRAIILIVLSLAAVVALSWWLAKANA